MNKENTGRDLLPHKHNACYQCQSRQVGCHSHCRAYLAFSEEAEKRRADHLEKIKSEEDVYSVFSNRQRDNARKRKRR